MRENMIYENKKLVFGVGHNDMPHGQASVGGKKYYTTWTNMLKRCYKENLGAKVCDEWLTFSNFKAWMEKQDWEGKHLDKDLLGDGTLYSPETCCFLPPKINSFLVGKREQVGKKSKYNGKYDVTCSDPIENKCVFLGSFHKYADAYKVWKEHKFLVANKLADTVDDESIKFALRLKFA